MEKAEPSIGYYMLAILMEQTNNNLVVTTNFDTLVEDALRWYGAKRPLVIGHESLVPFFSKMENQGRPVIAKVHRDLYFRPLNREEELNELAKGWKESLSNALKQYTPIVIGYGGGDQTLMKLLEQMELPRVYWCAYQGEASKRIKALLRKCEYGWLVNIDGFDEVMFELADQMIEDVDETGERMRTQVKHRIEKYEKQYASLERKISSMTSEEKADALHKKEP